MKKVLPLVLFGLAASTCSVLCAEVDLSKLPPASTEKGVTYAKDIRPLFEASCFRCHGEEKQKAELRLDSLSAALKGSEDGKVVIPGKSQESPLVIAVARLDEEKAMPPKPKRRGPGGPGGPGKGPGGPEARNARPPGDGQAPSPAGRPGGMQMPKPLTPEQVGLIRAWIDQGAK